MFACCVVKVQSFLAFHSASNSDGAQIQDTRFLVTLTDMRTGNHHDRFFKPSNRSDDEEDDYQDAVSFVLFSDPR